MEPPGATIDLDGGTDAVDLAKVSTSASGNPTIDGLSSGDSIGIGPAFTSATVNDAGHHGATATFSNGATTVAVIATPGSDNFYPSPYPTETIGGTPYHVAIVDPPTTGHGHTGPTGNSGSSGGWTGGAGAPPDPAVNLNTLLGSWDSPFQHGTGNSGTDHALMPTTFGQSPDVLNSLASDLTNIGGSGVGPWTPDGEKGHGAWTAPDTSGHGSVGGLDEDGKPHHHNLPPPHH